MGQWTPYNEKLFDLLILTFSENGKTVNLDDLKAKAGLGDEDWEDVLQYTVQVRGPPYIIWDISLSATITGAQQLG